MTGVQTCALPISSELFQNLKWSKLVHQRAVSKAIMMHRIENNTAPEYLTSRFVRRCDLTSYNRRENEYKLAVPQQGKIKRRKFRLTNNLISDFLFLHTASLKGRCFLFIFIILVFILDFR